jgi:hypothetical protein
MIDPPFLPEAVILAAHLVIDVKCNHGNIVRFIHSSLSKEKATLLLIEHDNTHGYGFK